MGHWQASAEFDDEFEPGVSGQRNPLNMQGRGSWGPGLKNTAVGAQLKAVECTQSEVGVQARLRVKGVNNVFFKSIWALWVV